MGTGASPVLPRSLVTSPRSEILEVPRHTLQSRPPRLCCLCGLRYFHPDHRRRPRHQQRRWTFHSRLADFFRLVHSPAAARGNSFRVESSRNCRLHRGKAAHHFDRRVDVACRTPSVDEMVRPRSPGHRHHTSHSRRTHRLAASATLKSQPPTPLSPKHFFALL